MCTVYTNIICIIDKSTGEYSVYKEVLGKEIMFHVSTLLPSQEQDVQRVS